MEFNGRQGRVILEKGSNLLEVPFAVDENGGKQPAIQRPMNQRYVKP
jgi:hypothetical protein